MTPSNHHGRTAHVRYYECTSATKCGGTACPVRRVNAHSVHAAVLKEIQRAAQPTCMTELIREAVKKQPEPQKTNDMLQALNRRIREVDKKIGNCLAAIEASGRAAVSLVKRLETLEAKRVSVQTERQQVEYQIAESRLARPNVERSMQLMGKFGELWEKATEEERGELLPLCLYFPMFGDNAVSSEIHLSSPCQSSPCLFSR